MATKPKLDPCSLPESRDLSGLKLKPPDQITITPNLPTVSEPATKQPVKPLVAIQPTNQDDLQDLDEDAVTRLDTTVKNWENTFCDFRTVKMKSTSFLRSTRHPENQILYDKIADSVEIVNHGIDLVYRFLNFHILRLLDKNKPDILPKQITSHLIQLAFIAVTNKDNQFAPSQKLRDDVYLYGSTLLFRQHLNESAPKGQYPFPSRNYRTYLFELASATIAEAIKNHLELNLAGRLAKYLRITYTEDDGAKANYLARRILNIIQPNPEWPSQFDGDPDSQTLIAQFKQELKISGTDPVKVSHQLHRYLPLYHKFLQCFEEHETKLFSILPQKGTFGDSCIKIDTCSLARLILLDNSDKNISFAQIIANKRVWWDKFFQLNRIETGKFRFANEIITNGYEINITIKRQSEPFPPDYQCHWTLQEKADYIGAWREKKRQEAEADQKTKPSKRKKTPEELEADELIADAKTNPFAEIEWQEYLDILGLDTGGRNLINYYDPETRQRIRVSGSEWRCRTGQTAHVAWNNRRKDLFFEAEKINAISFKTADYEQFVHNLRLILPKLAKLYQFYGADCYKKKKFTKYLKIQQMYQVIRDRVDLHKGTGQMTILGFGDGSVNNKGVKGPKGPNEQLFVELQKSPTIFCRKARERYSTKRCCKCYHDTVDVHQWKDIKDESGNVVKRIKVRIYGLRRCSNNECRITWDRDCNASPNIRAVVVAQIKREARPKYLTKAGALTNARIEALKAKYANKAKSSQSKKTKKLSGKPSSPSPDARF